jgi:hypothetical protein
MEPRSRGIIDGETVIDAPAGEPNAQANAGMPLTRPATVVQAIRAPRALGIAGVCLLALVIGGTGITDEGHVSLHGDMPRHLMNGVFFLDLTRDFPFQNLDTLIEYTRHYYARYPALSLGLHPPLIAVAEAPAYALLGVSVGSARVVVLLSYVLATALVYVLARKSIPIWPALVAAALFALSPHIVILSQSVLSEMLTLALLLLSIYFLDKFCDTQEGKHLAVFAATAVLSLYAKQVAVFAFPTFAFILLYRLGVRRLFRRDIIVTAIVMLVAVVPLALMTWMLSGMNVGASIIALTAPPETPLSVLREALTEQFALPALLLSALGMIRALVIALRSRDWAPLIWVVGALSALGCMVELAPFEPARYGIYAVPALCILGGVALAGLRDRTMVAVGVVVAVLVVGAQAGQAFSRPAVRGATGYEAAARFVIASNPGPTVLFSGDIDTGFFTFFIRKHDAARRMVVLRSDKVLTTSFMGTPSIQDRIARPDEIYAVLHRFGTRYVVIEDRPSASRVLEWLRTELRSPHFAERMRIPIGTSDTRLLGTDLAIYEYLDASPPAPNAMLSLSIPVIGRSVDVSLTDLINRRHLR